MDLNITVTTGIGSFNSIEEAAFGEEKLNWNVEEGADHRAVTLCFGAHEISAFLSRISDVKTELKEWKGISNFSSGVIILTVDDPLPEVLEADQLNRNPQGFSIRTITGKTGKFYAVIGADRQGALYGCYYFLELLGFAWLGPEDYETVIPNSIPDPLPELTLDETPSFLTRGFHATNDRGSEALILWIVRNKCNLWTSKDSRPKMCRKLGILMEGGGHSTFHDYLPPEKYFDENPEWYALSEGERKGNLDKSVGYNICLSNDEARKTLAGNMVEDLISGQNMFTDIIRIWPLDNGNWCECDECNVLGNPTDQMLLLAHDCRSAVKEARKEGRIGREVKIGIPAYHETLVIPSKPLPADFDHLGILVTFFTIERCYVHGIADPSCREINQDLIKLWKAWTQNPGCPFRGDMYIGEYYNVSSVTAMAVPFMHTMAEDIPYYRNTGAAHINYMHIVTKHWGLLAACNYQFASLIWNSEKDSNTILNRYFSLRYGRLAGTMKRFYQILEKAMANCKLWKHYAGMKRHTLFQNLRKKGSPNDPAVITTTKHFSYGPSYRAIDDGPSITETMDLLSEAERVLDDALMEFKDATLEKRLNDDIRRFRFTKNMASFIYRLIRLRMLENEGLRELAEAEARALRDSGETLRREEDMTQGQWNDSRYRFYDNGLNATWFPVTYQEIMEEYGLETPDSNETMGEHRLG